MDKKTIIATVASTAVTLIVTLVIGYLVGVFEKGVNAAEEETIKRVIANELRTAEGISHAAALASIDKALSTMEAHVTMNTEQLKEIRQALITLASEP